MMNKIDAFKSFVSSNIPLMVKTLGETDLAHIAREHSDATIMLLDAKHPNADSIYTRASNFDVNFDLDFINDLIKSHSNAMLILSNVNFSNESQFKVIYDLVVNNPCPLILICDCYTYPGFIPNEFLALQSRCIYVS